MGSIIDCFFLTPSEEAEESLRRFTYTSKGGCSLGWGHDAFVAIGVTPWPSDHDGCRADDFDHADPRWPATCERCGYVFQPDDHWQHNYTRLYVRSDNGEKTTLSAAPVGAMWDANWLRDLDSVASMDGQIIVVRTPGGDWNVDSRAAGGGGWTRTGVVPKITVTPSILTGKGPDGQWIYHGWLTNGKLVEC